MATAGIFTLITNDGKQDRMLMATQLLKRRLTSIKQARAQAGMRDTTPTLLDIERTHVLFMNAHFKPFAAIGFEYHKGNLIVLLPLEAKFAFLSHSSETSLATWHCMLSLMPLHTTELVTLIPRVIEIIFDTATILVNDYFKKLSLMLMEILLMNIMLMYTTFIANSVSNLIN